MEGQVEAEVEEEVEVVVEVEVQVEVEVEVEVEVQVRVQVHLLGPDLGDVQGPGPEDHPGLGPAPRAAVGRGALVLRQGG